MPEQKGIHDLRTLPDPEFDGMWESIILPPELKDRMLAQAVLNFTARRKLQEVFMPLHGRDSLGGSPGTGKTSAHNAPVKPSPAPTPKPATLRPARSTTATSPGAT